MPKKPPAAPVETPSTVVPSIQSDKVQAIATNVTARPKRGRPPASVYVVWRPGAAVGKPEDEPDFMLATRDARRAIHYADAQGGLIKELALE